MADMLLIAARALKSHNASTCSRNADFSETPLQGYGKGDAGARGAQKQSQNRGYWKVILRRRRLAFVFSRRIEIKYTALDAWNPDFRGQNPCLFQYNTAADVETRMHSICHIQRSPDKEARTRVIKSQNPTIRIF
jgi:hypothetical protein